MLKLDIPSEKRVGAFRASSCRTVGWVGRRVYLLICLPGWVGRCIPPCMPPFLPFVGSRPACLSPCCTWYGQGMHHRCVPFYTFDVGVEDPWVWEAGRGHFSPQEITLPWEETGRFRQRNPLQRVLLHKDDGNVLTPPQVSSNPPQGKRPPFNSSHLPSEPPVPGRLFLIKCPKSDQNPPFGHPIFRPTMNTSENQNGQFVKTAEIVG